jgi:hypothetical protein
VISFFGSAIGRYSWLMELALLMVALLLLAAAGPMLGRSLRLWRDSRRRRR